MQSLAGLTAAILVGGFGTRLRPVVADRPKVLAEVRGRPFLTYLLDQAAAAGLKSVVLCTGYMGDRVQAVFGDTYGGLHLTYSQEVVPLGTAGALHLALPLLASDPVLIMNGDSFCDTDLQTFWSWHCARGAEATILLHKTLDTKRYGRVRVNAAGRVLSFDEKSDNGGSGWINAGIYVLSRRLLLTIPVGREVSLEREIFPAWIGQGVYGYCGAGRFLDIGTPETYATTEQFFAPETLP
jgi:D-glycero-alpha-D-manno-heptose 1-phosphate guanylyltransferase